MSPRPGDRRDAVSASITKSFVATTRDDNLLCVPDHFPALKDFQGRTRAIISSSGRHVVELGVIFNVLFIFGAKVPSPRSSRGVPLLSPETRHLRVEPLHCATFVPCRTTYSCTVQFVYVPLCSGCYSSPTDLVRSRYCAVHQR